MRNKSDQSTGVTNCQLKRAEYLKANQNVRNNEASLSQLKQDFNQRIKKCGNRWYIFCNNVRCTFQLSFSKFGFG